MTPRTFLLFFFSFVTLVLLFWQLEQPSSVIDHHPVAVSPPESTPSPPSPPASSVSPSSRRRHQHTPAANRAPFLTPKRIAPAVAEEGGGLLLPDGGAECWDRLGSPTRTPSFVPTLFSKIGSTAAYRDIHRATEDDPWAVLIGWVPSRFMGPQPVGKDSQGRRMVPPTRGRDPDFYLREYNSSWHVFFTDEQTFKKDGSKLFFQLGHRNAFAVCVRERIHLHVRRCRPSPALPPILIHSCLCRKCDEKAAPSSSRGGKKLDRDILQLPADFPSVSRPEFLFLARSVLMQQGVQTLHRVAVTKGGDSHPQEERHFPHKSSRCLSVFAAPWLVSKTVMDKFPYEGLEHDLDALLAVQAEPRRRHVMVTIFNAAWVDHLLNWVFSLGRNGGTASYIIATMDDASLDLCRKLRLPCYDAGALAEKEDDEELRLHPERRRVSEAMSWIKPRLAVAVLGRGYGFWMVDLDMSWNSNPIPHVVASAGGGGGGGGGGGRTLDVVHQCDAPSRFSINSGFYDAAPTLSSLLFFSDMMTFTPEENADQAAMRLFGRYDHTHGMLNDCLNKWQFDMKCNYKVSNSVKTFKSPTGGPLQQSFEWNPVERNRSKFRWVMHHATCLSGAMAKVSYLRTINAWFLDDLEQWEEHGGEECWTLPSGKEVHVPSLDGLKTPHSPKYVRDIDERFLQRRH